MTRGSTLSRALAAALVAMLCLAIWLFIIAPVWSHFSRTTEAIHVAEDRLARFATATARPGPLSHPLSADALLAGERQSMAAARLQNRFVTVLEARGGVLESLTMLPAEPAGAGQRVQLEARAVIDHAGLAGLLYDLESDLPRLWVPALTIEADRSDATQGPRLLSVRLVVAGLWLPERAATGTDS